MLNGAKVEEGAMVSAGALVTQNSVVPKGSLAVGVPAKVKRAVKEEKIKDMQDTIEEYRQTAEGYFNK